MVQHHLHMAHLIPESITPSTQAESTQNPPSALGTLDPTCVLAMSTEPSDGAMASATEPKIDRSRLSSFIKIRHNSGASRSISSDREPEPPPAAKGSSQSAEDINVPSIQAGSTSSNLPRSPASPYGKGIPILGSDRPAYFFPDASDSITPAHKNRFRVLVEIFQKNVETSSELRDYSQKISYELRICGSLTDASASVLVCCPADQLTEIESLFRQQHISSQYEPDRTIPNFVRLGLFFYPETNIWMALHELAVVMPEELGSGDSVPDAVAGLMPWGLRILGDRGVQHTAIMGCVLQVGRDRFGLTTAHVFNHAPAPVPIHRGEVIRHPDTGDENYDMRMEQGKNIESSMNKQPVSSLNSHGRTVTFGKRQVHTALSLGDTSTWAREHANLDWALIELGLNDSRLLSLATTVDALTIVEHLPQQRTKVLIITRDLPGVPAILYGIPSYIGGAKGSPAAEVWTVGCLPEEHPIRKGQSGSIVVDAESGYLYGMVIAANPFGDIHIAPFVTVLEQVEELFKNDSVCVFGVERRRGRQIESGKVSEGGMGSDLINGPLFGDDMNFWRDTRTYGNHMTSGDSYSIASQMLESWGSESWKERAGDIEAVESSSTEDISKRTDQSGHVGH